MMMMMMMAVVKKSSLETPCVREKNQGGPRYRSRQLDRPNSVWACILQD
jgi:hypothetical protein